jgi:RimJ/RimL family protein N-acetyltransferase
LDEAMSDEHVRLGPLITEDSPLLWQWINTRELVVQSSSYRPVHAGTHAEWFARIQKQDDCVLFAIRLMPSNTLIGSCQLHTIQPVHRSAELQVRIGDADCRHKGYGTQTMKLLLQYGFGDLNLNRIHLHVLANNQAARRLYERFHFRQEGCLRSAVFIDGRFQDVVLMALLRDEYFASREVA